MERCASLQQSGLPLVLKLVFGGSISSCPFWFSHEMKAHVKGYNRADLLPLSIKSSLVQRVFGACVVVIDSPVHNT